MTRDEFLKSYDSLSGNPENLTESLLSLRKEIEGVYGERDALTSELETTKEKVSELQDTNHKLYLQLTSSTIESTVEEKEESIDEWYRRMGEGE